MNKSLQNTLLGIIVLVLLVVVLYYGYSLFSTTLLSDSETQVSEYDPRIVQYVGFYPDLGANEAYVEASFAFAEGDYSRARKLFLQAAQDSNLNEDAALMVEGRAAVSAYEMKDYLNAARDYKNAVANERYSDEGTFFKSNYVRMLAVVYADSNYSQDVFSVIFTEEPKIIDIEFDDFTSMSLADHEKAYADLLELSARGPYDAPIEYDMTHVNTALTRDFVIYDAFFKSCRDAFDSETGACTPDILSILTTAEAEAVYQNLQSQVLAVVAQYEDGQIEALAINDDSLFRAYMSLAQLTHKALYYGFTDEALVRSVNQSLLEHSQFVETERAQQAVLEYAIFLALSFSDASERSEIAETLLPLSTEDSLLYLSDADFVIFLERQNKAYTNFVSGSYTNLDLIFLRSQVALSLFDPVYKDRLNTVLGWDLDRSEIQALVEEYFPKYSNVD